VAMGMMAVPIRQRTIAWASSTVVGVAMYSVFGAVLTTGLAREVVRLQGQIDGIVMQAATPPAKSSPEQDRAEKAEWRATVSVVHALYQLKAELVSECRARRFWTAMIALTADVGCFALCSVYWRRRGAKLAAAAAERIVRRGRL